MIVLFSTELHSSSDKIFLDCEKIFLDKLIIFGPSLLSAQIYHGQEWFGFENIPDGGALIIYYHGVVPVDYFGLIAEMWLREKKVVHSVVDRWQYH